MNARNKLKTCDLMRIDAHIVYHAHRKSGDRVSLKTDGSWGSEGSSIQIQVQGWGLGLFKS